MTDPSASHQPPVSPAEPTPASPKRPAQQGAPQADPDQLESPFSRPAMDVVEKGANEDGIERR